MTRGLFFSFFIRMTIALAFVALMRVWFTPRGWIFGTILVLAWAAINAFLLSRSVRQSIALLQTSTAAIPDRPVGALKYQYSDFDGLAQAISLASGHVERVLMDASESRRELEAMIDSMQDAVVAVDQAGRIQWTNQRMQRLIPGTSFSSAVRVGHALVQTIRDPDVLACVKTALEDRVVSERRSTSLLPGRIFEVAASPMPGGGAVAVLHDITRIEQVERTQRDFVANVSHELRTPLTSITGYVETLLDHENSLSPQAREFLTTILKNATRMNRLTEDLLVMARVESSEQELHPAPVRADILVRDAVQAMSGLVQDEDAVLEIGQLTDVEVFADTDSILQVLSNLIENAIKYGRARDELHCRVIVSAREISEPIDAIEFSVRDFGQGIASEHLNRIFERFYRVDKARSRESGGTGLGLAIAQYVVQSQGGSIRAESELNAGSTFIFTLPKAKTSVV
ncbi:two-component system phosphate regulon sensor histidine kinase PhoR [Edaphobacter aggregans]|uniref:histidine kinase n=1 Tax=Edaphobacter aggregans TaxID=570835 RepID=A0A3R9WET5_9BACT|nr:ATP-binding protein [Edaphobacter aggregans]RSL15437.1 two-component system phosphate regulon sensor histidine kinase PhoR [Edaphobacter aggregans]